MNNKMKNGNGWILCRSKTFSGRLYYFNVLTGETAWSCEVDKYPFQKNCLNKETDNSHSYPEPSSPPVDYNSPESSNTGCNMKYIPTQKHTKPTFGQVSFPKYVSNVQYMPNIVWTPIEVPTQSTSMSIPPSYTPNIEKRKRTFDQGTQTKENIFMPRIRSPVLKPTHINFNSTPQKSATALPFQKRNSTIITDHAMNSSNVFGCKRNIINYRKPFYMTDSLRQTFKKPVVMRARSVSESTYLEDSDVEIYEGPIKKTCRKRGISLSNITDMSPMELEPLFRGKQNKTEEVNKKNVILGEKDLRHRLVAKRNNPALQTFQNIKTPYNQSSQALVSKRVSFNLSGRSEPVFSNTATAKSSANLDIRYLSNLGKQSSKTDCWYLVPDVEILLNDFDFIRSFVKNDPRCRIFVSHSIYKAMEAQSIGECRGRPQAMLARQLLRNITYNDGVVVVDEPRATSSESTINEDILNCCLMLMQQKYHVVLITKDEELHAKAKSLHLHSFKLNEIRDSQLSNVPKFNLIKVDSKNTNDNVTPFRPIVKKTINFWKNEPTSTSFLKPSAFLNEKRSSKENIFLQTQKDYQRTNQNLFSNNRKITIDKESTVHLDIDAKMSNLILDFEQPPPEKKIKSIFDDSESEFSIDLNKGNMPVGYSIEDALRRFCVKNKMVDDRIRNRLDEWECSLTQIMEDALTEVIQSKCKTFTKQLPPPWTLHEATEQIKRAYSKHDTLRSVAEKLVILLTNYSRSDGKLQKTIKSSDFMKLFGCCVLLLQALQTLHPTVKTLTAAEVSMLNLLKLIEDPSLDPDPKLLANNAVHRSEDEADNTVNTRKYCSKDPADIYEYLAKHYPQWKTFSEEIEARKRENKEMIKSPIKQPQIFRTVGKDLNLLKITNRNTMSLTNEIQKDEHHNESNFIIENKIINEKYINDNSSNDEDNKVDNKLHITKHENTFANLKEANGPKVIRNVGIIEEFENRIKTKFDLDTLDYSDISENTGIFVNGEKNEKTIESIKSEIDDHDDENFQYDGDDDEASNNSGFDSGIENEQTAFKTSIKGFVLILCRFLKTLLDFINKSLMDLCKSNLGDNIKCDINERSEEMHSTVTSIIKNLKSIIQRESTKGKSVLVMAGHDNNEYRNIVKRCLTQAQILEKFLKIILRKLASGDLSVNQ